MDILKELTGSSARAQLLHFFAHEPETEIQFGDLQKKLSINPRQLTLQLQKLVSLHLVTERKEGNRKYYRANQQSKYFGALKAFVSHVSEEEIWRWERAATIHHLYCAAMAAMKPMDDYFGTCWPTILMIYTDENVLWCCKESDLSQTGANIIEWYRKANNAAKYEEDVQTKTATLENILEEVGERELASLTNEKLLALYEKMQMAYIDWYAILWATEPVSVECEKYLTTKIGSIQPQDFATLTALTKESFSQEIEESFENLIDLARQKEGQFDDATLRKKVREFQKSFFWMYNNYFETRVVEEEEIILDCKKKLKSEPRVHEQIDITMQKAELIEKLQLDAETRDVLHISNEFIYWQDLRKKWIMIYAHFLEKILEEIGRRGNVPLHDMRYTMPEEMAEVLKGTELDLKARQENCLIVCKEGEEHGTLFVGDRAKTEEKKYFSASALTSEEEVLKGTVACGGKAIGTVKVLMNPNESYKVNHGDILVTAMTSPDFMQAIRKCVGIVTNDGGITCHAAVIARELNIPCVIGTKVATQVLKDGDQIELDADQGIVSIVR